MSHFFAYLARMKYIQRWGLMRNTRSENIQEHSLQVAMVAHALALLKRQRFGDGPDPERTATLAVFHDAEEVITGDLPTPIKYFSPQVAKAIDGLESVAKERLLMMLPDDLQPAYRELFGVDERGEALPAGGPDAEAWQLIKAADTICAYLKCVEERIAGNGEFVRAEATILRGLERHQEPAVRVFMETFVRSFELTLDELN